MLREGEGEGEGARVCVCVCACVRVRTLQRQRVTTHPSKHAVRSGRRSVRRSSSERETHKLKRSRAAGAFESMVANKKSFAIIIAIISNAASQN